MLYESSATSVIAGPITGAEPILDVDSPTNALIAFYHGFNCRDIAALEEVWARDNLPSMDNPIGGIRRGWDEIAAGYRLLFAGPAQVLVEFHDYSVQAGDDWALFVGRERGTCRTERGTMEIAIRTTRWFVRFHDRWRQLHHHGSFERGSMLSEYQRLILGLAS
jgi:hypothetical protein